MANIEFDPIINLMRKRVGNFVYSQWKKPNIIRRYNPKKQSEASEAQLKVRGSGSADSSLGSGTPITFPAFEDKSF